MKTIMLNDGNRIPEIGFGTYKATVGSGHQVVLDALRAGYRLIDTAKVYENEEDVAKAIKQSGIPREELFLASKLDRNLLGYDNARSELEKSLKRLGIEYIDLYLLHWPRSDYGKPDFDDWKRLDIESWKALEEMRQEGMIAVTVSTGLDEGHAPARRAYERAGFEKHLDSVTYCKML